jgi:hypothetical protein
VLTCSGLNWALHSESCFTTLGSRGASSFLISFLPILPKLAVLPRLKSENAARGVVVATPTLDGVRTDLRASGARRFEAVLKMVGSMYMLKIKTIRDLRMVERERDGICM